MIAVEQFVYPGIAILRAPLNIMWGTNRLLWTGSVKKPAQKKQYAALPWRHEAYEEAGLGGQVSKKPIGEFEYGKRLDNGKVQPCRVEVFAFEQMVQHPDWPEQGQRTMKWFSVPEAAEAVDEPDLKDIIRKLA